MSERTIQIRNVPDDTHSRLRSRAALAGMSLSDYVLAELHRLAERPSPGSPSQSGIRDERYEEYERLRWCRDDLREAKRYVEHILKKRYFRSRPFTIPANAAYTAFVVTYGRPFSGNRDRRGRRVPARPPGSLPDDEAALHDRILKERNKVIAHSDGSERQITLHRRGEIRKGVRPDIGDES